MIFRTVSILVCWCAIVSCRPEPEEYPPPEFLELMKPIHDDCSKKLGVSEDEIKNYVITDKREKMMCYMKCLMEELKMMESIEEINYDLIEKNVHQSVKDIGMPLLDKCHNSPVSSNECETVYNFNLCMQQEDPVHWFLP